MSNQCSTGWERQEQLQSTMREWEDDKGVGQMIAKSKKEFKNSRFVLLDHNLEYKVFEHGRLIKPYNEAISEEEGADAKFTINGVTSWGHSGFAKCHPSQTVRTTANCPLQWHAAQPEKAVTGTNAPSVPSEQPE